MRLNPSITKFYPSFKISFPSPNHLSKSEIPHLLFFKIPCLQHINMIRYLTQQRSFFNYVILIHLFHNQMSCNAICISSPLSLPLTFQPAASACCLHLGKWWPLNPNTQQTPSAFTSLASLEHFLYINKWNILSQIECESNQTAGFSGLLL